MQLLFWMYLMSVFTFIDGDWWCYTFDMWSLTCGGYLSLALSCDFGIQSHTRYDHRRTLSRHRIMKSGVGKGYFMVTCPKVVSIRKDARGEFCKWWKWLFIKKKSNIFSQFCFSRFSYYYYYIKILNVQLNIKK